MNKSSSSVHRYIQKLNTKKPTNSNMAKSKRERKLSIKNADEYGEAPRGFILEQQQQGIIILVN